MRRSLEKRIIEFRGALGDVLERHVTLPDGRQYAHRCSEKVFQDVAGYLEEHPDQYVTLTSIADAIDAPLTQVNVALELLKERCLVMTESRKNIVAEGYRVGFYDHAMCEFHAIIEGHPPQLRAPQ